VAKSVNEQSVWSGEIRCFHSVVLDRPVRTVLLLRFVKLWFVNPIVIDKVVGVILVEKLWNHEMNQEPELIGFELRGRPKFSRDTHMEHHMMEYLERDRHHLHT